MHSPESTRAQRAVKPVTLESIADIARATIKVVPNVSLAAIELHVDHVPTLLLSDTAVAALLEALVVVGDEP